MDFGAYNWKDSSSYIGKCKQGKMHGCGASTVKDGKQFHLRKGQVMSNDFFGAGLACPVQAAKCTAKETDDIAKRANRFEL